MSRKIDPAKAASWSDEEREANIAYLEMNADYESLRLIGLYTAEGQKEPTTTPAGSDAWFSEATANEVSEWVGDDKDRANEALRREAAREDPRKGLTKHLESLVE